MQEKKPLLLACGLGKPNITSRLLACYNKYLSHKKLRQRENFFGFNTINNSDLAP